MCQSNTKTIEWATLKSPFKMVDEPALTASEFLLERANFYVENGKADHPFLIDAVTSESYTFADFIRFSSNAANWFYARGMERGDTVIYLPVNFSKMYFIFCGVWQANGVTRSLYPDDTAETLLERVKETKVKWIYCEGKQAEQVLGVAAQCDWPIQVIVNGRAENCIALDDVLNFDGKVSPTLEVTADDPALILCTSGTTGKCKGAVRTHRSVVNIYRVHSTFPWGERSLCMCKGTHISGTFIGLANLAVGKTTILVCRLNPLDFFRRIHEYRPDTIHTFPTVLAALVRDGERDTYDLSSINRIITGGAGLTAPTANMIRTELPHVQHIITIYGLTESMYAIVNLRYSRDGKCDIFDAPTGSTGVVSLMAHFMNHPVYGIMYVVLFLNCTLLYVLVYDKAFRTPSLLEQVKGTFRLQLNRERNSFQRKIMDRRVMSIPMLGVKVGAFHVMERKSSPVFLHYVLSSIVSMLLAYA